MFDLYACEAASLNGLHQIWASHLKQSQGIVGPFVLGPSHVLYMQAQIQHQG